MGSEHRNLHQSMVDEMTRFEKEIGQGAGGYATTMPQFVIGTNTFSQAKQSMEGSFIPGQIMAPSNVIPPPPAPPMSMPPAGMKFAPGIPMPFRQVIAPPQPNIFSNHMMVRKDTPSVIPTAISTAHPQPSPWPVRSASDVKISRPDESKVVLSATPKLYTPNVEKTPNEPDAPVAGMGLIPRLADPVLSNRINEAKRFKPNEPPVPPPIKFTPTPVSVANYSATYDHEKVNTNNSGNKKKKYIRVSGSQKWEDPTLSEWDEGDFRLFCGDLGNDVTDELLTRIFSRYPSFVKAKVVRDKRTNKTKGYGFVSFKDPQDFIKASKEMNGRYVGSRPIKLRKSTWKNRNLDTVKKKEKEKQNLLAMLAGNNK